MSKQRRDSLARSGWFPIKTYNQAIYELEIEGIIEIRSRMVEWKKNLYYRFTAAGGPNTGSGRTRGQAAPW